MRVAIPHLRRTENGHQLIVNGQPFLMRAAELQNSSLSSDEYMRSIWPMLVDSNINTCLGAVTWEQIEPEEGRFDFENLEQIVKDARAYNLKLVLLWFGAFKNGMSTYAPSWVKRNSSRFPRVVLRKPRGRMQVSETLSLFDDEARKADSKAFATFMQHLRSLDDEHHTVIMVQVENEVGILGDSRDASQAANKCFTDAVPSDLISTIEQQWHKLHPSLKTNLTYFQDQRIKGGSWEDVFGRSAQTDELFMAYHYALYLEEVTATGKSKYALPLFTNVWQNYADGEGDDDMPTTVGGGGQPGDYPSGGAVINVLDIWQNFAPSLDFIAPDIYLNDYNKTCAKYRHGDQALFIPEQRRDEVGARRIWSALGNHHALGASPFGIDTTPAECNAFKKHYALVAKVSRHILEAQQYQHRCVGFFFDEIKDSSHKSSTAITAKFGAWHLNIERAHVFGKPGPGFGMVIWLENDRFLLIGEGFQVRFSTQEPHVVFTGLLSFVEKDVVDEQTGLLKSCRILNGDETMSGAVAIMPSEDPDYGDFPIAISIPARTKIAECTVYCIKETGY